MRSGLKLKARTIAGVNQKTATLKSKTWLKKQKRTQVKCALLHDELKTLKIPTCNASCTHDSFHAYAFRLFVEQLSTPPSPAKTDKDAPHQLSISNQTLKRSRLAEFGKDVVAGNLSGVAVTAVGHPLDTIKTLMQTQSGSQYSTISRCARTIFQQGSILGFYQGASAPLALSVLYSSVYYSSYMQARLFFGIGDRSQEAPAHLVLAACTFTGFCTTFVRAPMDLMKTQAQVSALTGNSSQTGGAFSLGYNLVKQHGFLSLFRGFVPSLGRQVVGASAWFFSYEHLKRVCGDGAGGIFLSGGLASWVYWTLVYPIDVIKTRVQSPGSTSSSSWNCLKNLLRVEGARGLFRGYVPCMLRAFPANAAGIVAYEQGRLLVDGLLDE